LSFFWLEAMARPFSTATQPTFSSALSHPPALKQKKSSRRRNENLSNNLPREEFIPKKLKEILANYIPKPDSMC